MARVFLSHSSSDRPLAKRIAADLEAAGIVVWLDEWAIRVGEPISARIEDGLERSDFVVVLLSERSVASRWVEREWQAKFHEEVTTRRIIVLPVLAEPCDIPVLLRDKRHVDLAGDYDVAIADLVRSIHSYAYEVPERTRTPSSDTSEQRAFYRLLGFLQRYFEQPRLRLETTTKIDHPEELRDRLATIERRHPDFNYRPMSLSAIHALAVEEGIRLHGDRSLPVDCCLTIAPATAQTATTTIFIRDVLDPPRRLFLLCHELGHLLLNVPDSYRTAPAEGSVLVGAFVERDPVAAHRAEHFAMLALLPTPTLCDLEARGELSVDAILRIAKEVVEQSVGSVGQYEDFLRRFCEKRIRVFERYMRVHMVTWPFSGPIQREDVPFLARRVFDSAAWALFDENETIVEASDLLAKAMGLAANEIVGREAAALMDDVSYGRMRASLMTRRNQHRSAIYYARYNRGELEGVTSVVQVLPILDSAGRYAGSFAVVRPECPP